MRVELKEITRATVRAVCKLDAGDGGRQVAPNAVSLAEALFYDEAWYRAIAVGEDLVGFVMLYDPTLAAAPEEPDFFLWRLMIDHAYQRHGYGRDAVLRLFDHVASRPGAERLLVSHVEAAENLGRFYSSLGFEYTGEVSDGERVMMRSLSGPR